MGTKVMSGDVIPITDHIRY